MNMTIVVNQFVRQAAATVQLRRRRTGITGSEAMRASMYINPSKLTKDKGRETRTRGCVQGTILPPEFKPKSKRTSVVVRENAPRKSTRESFDLKDNFGGILTVKNTNMPEIITSGTCARNAQRQPQTSFTHPPNSPPSPAPVPKQTFPSPWMSPRFRKGTRSEATKVLIAMSPPPPIPATTLPPIIVHSLVARPHIRFPAANKMLLTTSPVPLLKISVNRPESGWQAALAIRYAEASHDNKDKELNEVEMGAERVAMIVESRAPRKTPT